VNFLSEYSLLAYPQQITNYLAYISMKPFEQLHNKLEIFMTCLPVGRYFSEDKELGVSLILLLIPINMSVRTDERDPILCLENE